ncbi:MAG TPA: hypothetical protein VD969_17555 [Symbiobacteriaceae bacterium]|nr:hypothetical protein [Symbiobacteriaceae bacterium]
MTGQTWIIIGVSAVAGIALGGFIVTRLPWYQIRKYAVDLKRVFDRHKVQEKVEAVQALGENPNPVLVKKPLREVISTYQALIADLEKVKVPAKAKDAHEETLTMHKESLSLYQMALTGGFRQRAMVEKQKKLMAMERSLTAKMEKLYGPMKKPADKKK